MVWGTYASRRPMPQGLPTIDVPPPRMIHCEKCGSSFVLMPGQEMPAGWKLVDDAPVCCDCLRGPSSLPIAPRRKSVGATGSRYRGCRIEHEIALGQVALQVRAGAKEPEGRDEVVQFMLGALELDQLIIHLSAIRGELTASQTPGTAAREGGLNG